ncbi:aldehyde dehydrogenase family protein [Mycoplasmopsis gallopavonis]|uniref:Aldehyde dehydrogenase n=1 Tax=Mycoplasmopsis gallopavonis TaxID=76629 RepID=A0A449AZX9_9BACT|nr:aldehyde dehydrogenase family protein [Mycoplasmopsis gallopavonis]RIV16404.1 aldehyde dehydrogenase family protein [Mycoplasmopsis gallopavonis]VEU73070.1 NAD-dependent aldehyde dehydrogenase domain-containing protein [Mycoplasmopsis gallopavonis]
MKKIQDYQTKITLLKQIKQMIYANLEQILIALEQDLQKPHYEIILTEVIPVIKELNFFLKKLNKNSFYKTKSWSPFSSYGYLYHPRGQVLICNTWNYPLQLLFVPLIGSIAAGNITTIKFHPYLKNFNSLMTKLIKELDPKSQLIQVDQTTSFVETFNQKTYDFVFFTGSYQTSLEIQKHLNPSQTEVCFELGGKSPFVITQSANLKKAAKMFCYAKLLNAGQTCIAPDYIFIDRKIAPLFEKELRKRISKLTNKVDIVKLFDKLLPSVRKNELQKHLTSQIKEFDYSNLILKDNDLNNKFYHQELFAPFALMYQFDHLSEFEKLYNQNPFPLSFYIFTRKQKDVDFFITSFPAGNYMINNTMSIFEDNKLSFGGIKTSGIGRYRGFASLELFSHKSSLIHKKGIDLLFKLKNYPYTSFKQKLLKLYLRFLK